MILLVCLIYSSLSVCPPSECWSLFYADLCKPVYWDIVQDIPLFTDSDSAWSLPVNTKILILGFDYVFD